MDNTSHFWDRLARRYAAQPIKDPTAYETTLDRTRTYLSTDDHVLELGCGTGSTALSLAAGTKGYVGTDISGGMIEIANEKRRDDPVAGLEFQRASVSEALSDPEQYDVIIGFNLLHLLENPDQSVARMRAALKPGGYLITKTVCLAGRRFYVRPMIGVMRFFGKAPFVGFHSVDDVDRMMTDAGLEIIETGNYPQRPPSHFIVARRT